MGSQACDRDLDGLNLAPEGSGRSAGPLELRAVPGTAPIRHSLVGISPKAYEHPADRAATAALASIPMMDRVVRKLIELGYERALRDSLLGNAIKIGPDQLPAVWETFEEAQRTLDMPERYDLYVTQMPFANAGAIGAGKPVVVVNSGLVALLDADELKAVLAHEVGHILSDHVLYRTALMILMSVGEAVRLPLLGSLPLMAVRSALLEWSRAAELSSDRAAALVVRDPLVVCRTLMTVAAGRPSRDLSLDAFMRQSIEYREHGDAFDRLSRFFRNLELTHALPVRRVQEVMQWVQGGDYDRIIGGDYRTRDQDVYARAEAGDAVDYYTERFRTILGEAGETVSSAGDRLGDWIRGGRE